MLPVTHLSQPLILNVENIFTTIHGPLSEELKSEIERKLSFRPEGFQFSPQYNKWIYNSDGQKVRRAWDGWKRQFWSNKTKTYFPTGLISLVLDCFKTNHIPFKTVNNRPIPQKSFFPEWNPIYEKRDYQTRVIDAACNATRGKITAATGSGKTLMSAGIIHQLNVSPFLFFVTSIDLLTQAKTAFQDYLSQKGSKLNIGQIGGGIIDIQDITICTIQTAVRALGEEWNKDTKFDDDDTDDLTPIENNRKEIVDLIHSAKGYIGDEIQHFRSHTCQLICRELKSAYYAFGVSATCERDQGDDMLIQACFGKEIIRITATELIEDGWLVRPNIKIVHIKNRKTAFKEWQSIYKDRVVNCSYYNNVIANIAKTYINNNDSVLVLVQQINHGKRLEKMIDGGEFLSGVSKKQKREDKLNELRNHEIQCIISSQIFDEGIDVRCLNTVILTGQGKSKVRAMQRIGRITRPYTYPDGTKKEYATAIDFRIHDKYLEKHSIEREKMYRTEPAYNIEHVEI